MPRRLDVRGASEVFNVVPRERVEPLQAHDFFIKAEGLLTAKHGWLVICRGCCEGLIRVRSGRRTIPESAAAWGGPPFFRGPHPSGFPPFGLPFGPPPFGSPQGFVFRFVLCGVLVLTFGFFWGTVIEAISCVTSSVKVNFFSDVQSLFSCFSSCFGGPFFSFCVLFFAPCLPRPKEVAGKVRRGQSRSKTENRLATNVGRGQSSCTALSRKPVPRTAHFSRDRPSCVQSRHYFCGNFRMPILHCGKAIGPIGPEYGLRGPDGASQPQTRSGNNHSINARSIDGTSLLGTVRVSTHQPSTCMQVKVTSQPPSLTLN